MSNVLSMKPKAKESLIGLLELNYLFLALDKMAEPMHPNLRATFNRMRQESGEPSVAEAIDERIRITCAKALTVETSAKSMAIEAAKALSDDVRTYTTFWKQLVSNVAFIAHMDCVIHDRSHNQAGIDAGIDALHEGDPTDPAVFDTAETWHDEEFAKQRESVAENNVETRTPISLDYADAESAVKNIQAWAGIAFTPTPEEIATAHRQKRLTWQEFWGVAGVFPLAQRKFLHLDGTTEYQPIVDFGDYRTFQNEQWNEKRRRVVNVPATTDLLMAA